MMLWFYLHFFSQVSHIAVKRSSGCLKKKVLNKVGLVCGFDTLFFSRRNSDHSCDSVAGFYLMGPTIHSQQLNQLSDRVRGHIQHLNSLGWCGCLKSPGMCVYASTHTHTNIYKHINYMHKCIGLSVHPYTCTCSHTSLLCLFHFPQNKPQRPPHSSIIFLKHMAVAAC